jgi:uncharacterized protein YciI
VAGLREQYYNAHREWLETQHRAGRVLFSGPTLDRSYGIYILLADSLEEAQDLAGSDPFHLYKVREPHVLQWDLRRYGPMDGSIDGISAAAAAAVENG